MTLHPSFDDLVMTELLERLPFGSHCQHALASQAGGALTKPNSHE